MSEKDKNIIGDKSDVSPKSCPKKHRVVLPAVLLALFCCAAVGGWWFVTSVTAALETLNHIMPGRSMAPSSSMKPYEISLRITKYDRKNHVELDGIDEWKLTVPRAFVVDESGTNGALAIATGSLDDSSRYGTRISLHLKDGSQIVVPITAVPKRPRLPNIISIRLNNRHAAAWISRNDLCVPWHKATEVAASYKAVAASQTCHETNYLCPIAMHSLGWSVVADVTQNLYTHPEEVCVIVKNFLRTHTVHQDDIR